MAPTNRRDELVEKAREVARRLGTATLSMGAFTRETGIGNASVYRQFDDWEELCRLAGLAPVRPSRRLSDDEVFAAMRDAFLEMGGIGSWMKFQRRFRHGTGVLRRRGFTWPAALAAFRAWAEANAPDFPYMDQLPEGAPPPRAAPSRGRADGGPRSWRADEGRRLGETIAFRAMLHAPVNEHGVVALFGMVAEDLGFAIESVATDFPDCEAKRRVAGGWWQRVRIEFEFQSRNFRDHGHDPEKCDLIVCWEHNWPDCPLEAVELKAEIAALCARGRGAEAPRRPVP